MAGVYSKAEVKEIDLLMTCCLGYHPLQNPRLLPCQHSCCKECIMGKVQNDHQDFVCPKCHLSIPLTKKDVDQLPENVLHQIMQAKKPIADCVLCEFDNKKTPGTFQCLDCDDVLCDQCHVGHTKSRLTRLHRVVSMKDIQSRKCKGPIQAEKLLVCQKHMKANTPMVLEYYCEVCKCLACQMCAVEEHEPKGHNCLRAGEIHHLKTRNIKEHLAKLLDFRRIATGLAEILKQESGNNKRLKEDLENEVHQRAAQFIDIVEKIKEDTLKVITGHFEKEGIAIQTKIQEAWNRIIHIDHLVTYSQAFLAHSDKLQLLQYENEIVRKVTDQKLQNMDKTLKTSILELGEPQFDQMECNLRESFGKIRFMTKKLKRITARDVPFGFIKVKCATRDIPFGFVENPKVLFHRAIGESVVYDLSVTNQDEIVTIKGSTIQVYSSDGSPVREYECNQLQDAWNVVAKGDAFYVSNHSSNGDVHVVDIRGKAKKTIKLPVAGQDYREKGVAVDAEGRVYISSYNTHTVYKCEPYYKGSNAKVFIERGKHPDLKGPWYLCTTPDSKVVVSNKDSHTVQVYDKRGSFLWQYKGQGDTALKYPWGVCCDINGYIYIADFGNHRIQMVKDEVLQIIVEIENLISPCGIDLDKDGNIVCFYEGGREIAKIKVWDSSVK